MIRFALLFPVYFDLSPRGIATLPPTSSILSLFAGLDREQAPVPPDQPDCAGLSGRGVAQIADSVVICLDALVLPLDERSYVGRQALLQRRFITSLGGILATLALGEATGLCES